MLRTPYFSRAAVWCARSTTKVLSRQRWTSWNKVDQVDFRDLFTEPAEMDQCNYSGILADVQSSVRSALSLLLWWLRHSLHCRHLRTFRFCRPNEPICIGESHLSGRSDCVKGKQNGRCHFLSGGLQDQQGTFCIDLSQCRPRFASIL